MVQTNTSANTGGTGPFGNPIQAPTSGGNEFFQGLFGGLPQVLGGIGLYNDIGDTTNDISNYLTSLGETANTQAQFSPWGFTSGDMNLQYGDGQTNASLSGNLGGASGSAISGANAAFGGIGNDANTQLIQQALNQQMPLSTTPNAYSGFQNLGNQSLDASAGLMASGMMDRGVQQQQYYDQIRAMQQPEEQRRQQALSEQLQAQGRTGISSEAYGGTPEQLAMSKAVAEAQNSAAYQANAMAEQQRMNDFNASGAMGTQGTNLHSGAQNLASAHSKNILDLSNGLNTYGQGQAGIGASLMGAGLSPYEIMNSLYGTQNQNNQLVQEGNLSGLGLMSELGIGAATAQQEGSNQQNTLLRQLIQGASQLGSSIGQQVDQGGGGWASILNKIPGVNL